MINGTTAASDEQERHNGRSVVDAHARVVVPRAAGGCWIEATRPFPSELARSTRVEARMASEADA